MPNYNRELSQFASFLNIDDGNKQIAITTDSVPFVGIGSTRPTEKLDVLGNIKTSGNITADSFYGDGSNLENIGIDFVSTPVGLWTGKSIGIGTSNFSQRLNVEGGVTAERFIAYASQGTAPFQVFSSTVVNNLNASLLNGRAAPNSSIVGIGDTQTLTNKTLTTPIVSNIINGSATITIPVTSGTLIHTGGVGIITSGVYGLDSINNNHINVGAGISYSKLNLTNSIVNSDIKIGAGISYNKINLANSIKLSDFEPAVITTINQKANTIDVYNKSESDSRYVQGAVQTEMIFTATAGQSVFSLSTAIINKPSALVTIDGIVQPTSRYSVDMTGTQLSLNEGVPVNTLVRVLALGVATPGAPADDTITTPKLRAGAVTPEKLSQPLTLMVSKAATGSSIDFTGIPNWVKRITVLIDNLSLATNADILIRIGSNGIIENSGYFSTTVFLQGGVQSAGTSNVTGFTLFNGNAANQLTGQVVISNISGNRWIATGTWTYGSTSMGWTAGSKSLSGVLDRLSFVSPNGTDLFDSGLINLLYE